MDQDLKVYELFKGSSGRRVNEFTKNVDSDYVIETNYEKKEVDFEWLEIMEDTIKYLDNILRNPNRFIVREEEVVNIEKARKTTVDSIKHLSKHTNFIQEIRDDGSVRPSRILNVNNEESFNTYENRLIYTLINNMNAFIELRKKNLILESSMKDNKKCTYRASTRVGAERVNIEVNMDSKLLTKEDNGDEGANALQRIETLEVHIRDLTNSAVYKALAKLHVSRVNPPVKKTNLILKNVNFQYAMRLWDYLQTHNALEDKSVKNHANIKDDLDLKQMLDDSFLLSYLTVNSVDTNQELIKQKKKEQIEQITANMINRIIELNADMPVEELQAMIGDKIAVIKNKKEASLTEVQDKIGTRIQSYLNRIESFKF